MRGSGNEGKTVYLAARFDRRIEMQSYIPTLNALGYGVPARWLTAPAHDFGSDDIPGCLQGAKEDVEDVLNADIFILFIEHEEVPHRSRGGRYFEFGAAVMHPKGPMTVVVGEGVESIFNTLADFRVRYFR